MALTKHQKYCKCNPDYDTNILYIKRVSVLGNKSEKRNNKKSYTFKCAKCERDFSLVLTESQYKSGKHKLYCSRSCANSRVHTKETIEKIRISVLKKCYGNNKIDEILKTAKSNEANFYKDLKTEKFYKKFKKCKYCGSDINNGTRYCNEWCRELSLIRLSLAHSIGGRKGGKKSAYVQRNVRRSKNEILFCKLCEGYFKSVLHNEPIFNGWDADVIIDDYKIAVLWNGKWHYEDICGGLKQIQNRDRIKISEITKCGYIPYIIKDTGKYNETFVKNEFEKLKNFMRDRAEVSSTASIGDKTS